jgi:hypothetical protein
MPFIGEQPAAEEAAKVTVTPNNSANETVYPVFVDTASGAQGAETDLGLTYNPSTGLLTIVKIAATALNVGGVDVTSSATELNLLAGKTFIDSDTMAGASATTLSSSESIVAYVATYGGAYSGWEVKTGPYTASSKDQLVINSASAVEITLPASPAQGDTVIMKNIGAGLITILRNGSNIEGSAQNGYLASTLAMQVVYTTAEGWKEI